MSKWDATAAEPRFTGAWRARVGCMSGGR